MVEEQDLQESRTFTQEEVNRIAGQARIDERAKFADYPDLKRKADELENLRHAQMTREEQLAAEAAEAKRQAEGYQHQMHELSIATEVRVKAMQKGIVDPDAALALINRQSLQYEDGQVKGVDEALEALVGAKPYLRGQPHAADVNAGRGQPTPPQVKLTMEQRQAAQAMGIKDDEYAKYVKPRS